MPRRRRSDKMLVTRKTESENLKLENEKLLRLVHKLQTENLQKRGNFRNLSLFIENSSNKINRYLFSKYMKFMKHKKSRVMDQMRKMDRNGTGYITNEDFIHHMVNSGFKTTEKEMRKVFLVSKRVACHANQTVINFY